MAKILLVNPPFYRVLGSHYNGISLGISYIASYLNKNGHDAWIYNADFLSDTNYKTLYQVYRDFNSYIDIFKNENDPIWKSTVESILRFDPDWVGYTSYTANISAIQILSKLVGQKNRNIKQIVGGVHSTLDRNILDCLPFVDYSISREGEETTLRLLNGENPNLIQGVSFRDNGKIVNNNRSSVIKNLDEMPFPERDKFWIDGRPATEIEKINMDVSYLITLRGCPYRCSFCASPEIWGRNILQYRSPENIKKEIIEVKKKYWNRVPTDYGVLSSNSKSKQELYKEAVQINDNTIIYFVDDVFTLKKNRALEIMQNIKHCDVPWKCESRADNIDEDIAVAMKESNCKRVKLGIESGSDRILKIIKKDETKDQMRKGINLLKKHSVPITVYLMAGFPDETDEDLQETIDFAKEIDADYYSISILSPYFGTQIYFDSVSSGIDLDKEPWEYFFHQSKKLLLNSKISDKKLEEFWKLCNIKKYI